MPVLKLPICSTGRVLPPHTRRRGLRGPRGTPLTPRVAPAAPGLLRAWQRLRVPQGPGGCVRGGAHNKDPFGGPAPAATRQAHTLPPCPSFNPASPLSPARLPREGIEMRSRSPRARWSVSPARAVLNVTCSTSWGAAVRLRGWSQRQPAQCPELWHSLDSAGFPALPGR